MLRLAHLQRPAPIPCITQAAAGKSSLAMQLSATHPAGRSVLLDCVSGCGNLQYNHVQLGATRIRGVIGQYMAAVGSRKGTR